jgi:hypothetical protein
VFRNPSRRHCSTPDEEQNGRYGRPNDKAPSLNIYGDGVKDAALKELKELIKKTPEFKKLSQHQGVQGSRAVDAGRLRIAIRRSLRRRRVARARAAGVLYITRTGGTVVNTAMDRSKGRNSRSFKSAFSL